MSQAATISLKDLLDSGEYEVLRNVPIFDEHDEYDKDGQLTQRFDRNELQEICDVNNARNERGDLTILGLGHTIPRDPVTRQSVPEHQQPPPVGYVANYHVGELKSGTPAIMTDLLIHKNKLAKLRDPDTGRISFERRSIELRPADKVIDWVALLRKAPARDLGLLTYSFDTQTTTPFRPQATYYRDAGRTKPLTKAVRGTKVFYSLEDHDMDPTKAPDAAAPDEEFSGKVDRYMAEKYPQLGRMHEECAARYAAEEAAAGATGPGAPSPTNVAIPGAKKKPEDADDEKLRMAREGDLIRYSRMEQELAALKAESEAAKKAARRARAAQRVQALQYAGFTLDPNAEITRYEAAPDAEWDKLDDHVRRYYRQDGQGMIPVGGVIDTAVPGPPGNGDITPEQLREISRVAGNERIPYAEAKKKVLARN